ncbi:MAG: lipase family protein [Gordonia amarae]
MRRRSGRLLQSGSVRAAGVFIAASALWASTAVTASAVPPNMRPVPEHVTKTIDSVVPPAPYPRLTTIPDRAKAPGYPHSVQELRAAILPAPVGDTFFDVWPKNLSGKKPGTILRSRDVTGVTAPLVTVPIRYARQLKFVSTDALGQPSFGTATIITPRARWTGRGSRPILINNLPIDSMGTKCTSGYTLAHGFSGDTNTTDFFPPTTQLALHRGYAVIVPDHEGPRMAYAEPTTAGHIVLDSVRAVSNYDTKTFGESKVGMTGYSGGAIATKGATKLAADYAPDVAPRLVGAALGGVPADYRILTASMNANLATGLFHEAMFGVARERPELLTLANNAARWLVTSPLKDGCATWGILGGLTLMPSQLLSNDNDPFNSPVAQRIYRLTQMADKKSVVPLYIYQGAQEFWIPPAGTRNLFAEQCRLGANVTYREVPGEHFLATVTGYPDALTWLDNRLQGKPAPDNCRSLAG